MTAVANAGGTVLAKATLLGLTGNGSTPTDVSIQNFFVVDQYGNNMSTANQSGVDSETSTGLTSDTKITFKYLASGLINSAQLKADSGASDETGKAKFKGCIFTFKTVA